jgi:transcription termination factor 2
MFVTKGYKGLRIAEENSWTEEDEVTGGRRKLHNEELHNLYSSPSIKSMIKSRRMRWAGHVARMRTRRNAYRILVGKLEGKRPLRRPRRRYENSIKMDLREIGWGGKVKVKLSLCLTN